MPTIYELKPRFQMLLRPACRRLARAGVTANRVTVLAAALSLAHGSWIALAPDQALPLLLLPVTLAARMALNAMDGILAREFGQETRLGAILNELGDAVSDAGLYLPFALVPGVSPTLVVLVVVLSLIAEVAGIAAIGAKGVRRYDGPFGKSDRAAAFGVLGVVLGLGLEPGLWTTIVLFVALVLCALTVFNRVRRAVAAGSPRS